MRKMRIACLAEVDTPGAWYRSIGPMTSLAARGHEIRHLMTLDRRFRPHLLEGCDILHIHRSHDVRAGELITYAKQQGMAVVWDNDDDLASVPKSLVAYRSFGGVNGTRSLSAVKRIVQLADLVTTPSRLLAERYREYGATNVAVIENYVRDESAQLGLPDRTRSDLIVGWMAGNEHRLDAERLPVRATFERLMDTFPHVRTATIGIGLGISDERYQHIKGVPFTVLDQVVGQLDIGIAPLADIPLNRGRSNLKVKEYAVVGLPWLASPIGPYVGLGEREGGELVADGGWFDAIARLITNERRRKKAMKRAVKWGRSQTVSAHAVEWERPLSQLLAVPTA